MRPIIHFEDVKITHVEKTTSKYNSKKKKHIDLKIPTIKKGKTLDLGNCFDLMELVHKLNHHIDNIDSYNDYLDINFKLTAHY